MKVLQVIPHLGAGGAEQAAVDINAALTAAGDQSLVISAGGNRVPEIVAAGGRHITLPVASKNPWVIMLNGRRLAKIIRDEHVDIVHARSRAPAWSALWAARQTGCRFITTFHAAYRYANPFKKLYNRVMLRGDHVIAISDFVAQHIRENYKLPSERITIIHRGIDLTRFDRANVSHQRLQTLRSLWKLKPQQRVILLPARLSPIKGQKILIAAMRLLREQGALNDTVAVIIGAAQGRRGYVRQMWEQIVGGQLSDHVVLADHCDDMPAAYAVADLAVMPSLVPEGFGRVPVEAQAMGVPVIATDLGATRETILPDVTGWLIPPDDPQALAEKIRLALTLTPVERVALADQATVLARQRFDLSVMTAATLAVYKRVLAT